MDTKNIRKARALARIAHAGQTYNDGTVGGFFERHVENVARRVAEDGGSERHIVVAYLHDIVEDTQTTLEDLHDLGFSTPIIEAVEAITRLDHETYFSEYLVRVAQNPIATFVKYHDLRANTNTGTRMTILKRNMKAMTYIKGALGR